MSSPITLRINGEEYLDFKSATVSYSIESFVRRFSFEFSDKWLQTLIRELPFREGDPCEAHVNGIKVVDGVIDDVPVEYDATSHSLSVSGRSWNAHMVDCSAVYKGGSWRKAKLVDIIRNLAEPFGVGVIVDPWAIVQTIEPFDRWAIEDEETAHGCMQRAAEMRGLFLTSDAGRNVVVTKASIQVHPATLSFGSNILRARRVGRFSDRHSYYLVKSQRAGSDTWYAEKAAGPFFRVDDPQVTSYRPLIIVSDGSGTKKHLETRATFERNMRAGKSRRITYDVQGLGTEFGDPWPINVLIPVSDPYLSCKEPLLIAGVTLSYGPGGEISTLELARPEAFDVLAPAPKKGRKKGFMSLL